MGGVAHNLVIIAWVCPGSKTDGGAHTLLSSTGSGLGSPMTLTVGLQPGMTGGGAFTLVSSAGESLGHIMSRGILPLVFNDIAFMHN